MTHAPTQTRSRDEQILTALTQKVRLLSLAQIATAWWGRSANALAEARARLALLGERQLTEHHSLLARPMIELAAPVFVWQRGEPAPDPEALAYQLQSRWQEAAEPVSVHIASGRYAKLVGLPGGKIKCPFQATHDLHVAAIYLRLLRQAPALAEAWIGETVLASERIGQKLPDAILRDPNGHDRLVIEFGGSYDAEHVGSFHNDCARRELPYQLW